MYEVTHWNRYRKVQILSVLYCQTTGYVKSIPQCDIAYRTRHISRADSHF
jgi:hypothetical protein